MATFNFNPPSSGPIDKRYLAFRDGFAQSIVDKQSYSGLRWIPWSDNGRWGVYKLEEWDQIDFSVIGPGSPLRKDFVFERSSDRWIFLWRWADV